MSWSPLIAVACVWLSLVAQRGVATGQDATLASDEVRARRLAEMKRQAAEYTLTLAGERGQMLELHAEPVLRFDNAVSGVPDGIAVFWKQGQRPAVFAQIFQTKEGAWIHECQSLAATGFAMRRGELTLWEPQQKGSDFRYLADAPAAEGSPLKRLAQMRKLAERFQATDQFKIHFSDRDTTKHELRLLPTPVYRYADEGLGISDAAVFAFVHGTDPEVFLILEHRADDKTQQGWHYAFAPLTCWEITVKRDDAVIWTSPERFGKSKPNEPYHVWVYKP